MTNQTFSLAVKSRKEKSKQLKKVREQAMIPAVLYGHGIKPVSLSAPYSAFEKLLDKAGESSLVDLSIDEKEPVKVLIQDYQLDPKTNQFIHVDFRQIRMDEKLHAEIEFKFIGEAPAVKELSGILVTNIDKVEVECLPSDLVHEIEVDISSLKTFEDSIHVSDIKVPSGIKVINHPEETVALVQPPRTEEELKAMDEKPQAAEIPADEKAATEGESSEENKQTE
jgi:large subunit ribosomal protein L25